MSLRLEMLQLGRLAPKMLGISTELVCRFLRSQQNEDGGFKDRAGRSDLYYTVFGMDSLIALRAPPPAGSVAAFLESFGDGEGLDFVHLCCLARCWNALVGLGEESPAAARLAWLQAALPERLERFRSGDGGYHPVPGSRFGTCYGCFLALGAYQDLGVPLPQPDRLAGCLRRLETPDGAWANERGLPSGSTNATAAAAAVLRHLDLPVNPMAAKWLLARRHPQGGFRASADAPLPDLLSTATALHALAGLGVSPKDFREECLDFIDSLWTNEGSFHGHWADAQLDCEYTFYGLLALGHLSL